MTKYRIRLKNGRVIGPFIKTQLFELKAKGHIEGTEEAQIYPMGNWQPLKSLDIYEEIMDENKTIIQINIPDYQIDVYRQLLCHKNKWLSHEMKSFFQLIKEKY